MKRTVSVILGTAIFSAALFTSCSPKDNNNKLTEAEKADGWDLLFDGKTLTNWKGFNDQSVDNWVVEDGCLTALGQGDSLQGDVVTIDKYQNFELVFDWKLSSEGNSGVMYHVLEGADFKAPFDSGPEYQLIDDLGYPYTLQGWQKTGADYGMCPREGSDSIVKPAGEWNTSKIIFDKGHVEHWLNGEKILAFEAWTEEWLMKKEAGKWANSSSYGIGSEGRIGLQDIGSKTWFRNIKVKKLKD